MGGQATASAQKSGGERINPHLEVPPYLSLHAKSLVVDGRLSYVGSYNLDPRSDSYNTEVGLLVADESFAFKLRESILADASPCEQLPDRFQEEKARDKRGQLGVQRLVGEAPVS